MKKQEKDTIKKCVADIEFVWLKIEEGKPIDHYDQGKLGRVVGTLNELIK